jgi:hypothetical protein
VAAFPLKGDISMDYHECIVELAKIYANKERNISNKERKMRGKELTQALNAKKVEYEASLDISEDRDSLAVFIKPNFRNHIEFDKEFWQVILELPITLVWDMLRNNLINADFEEEEVELIRRKNEALAAEKYLEEYEKT